jgi:hypothetical protein
MLLWIQGLSLAAKNDAELGAGKGKSRSGTDIHNFQKGMEDRYRYL